MDIKQAYLSKPWLKHYPDGVPEAPQIPDLSVPELIDQLTDKYANHAALIFYGKKITYGHLKELIHRFATGLADQGVEKGDATYFTLLRSFLKNFPFKWGATRHFIGILNQITKEDWQPWFEKYVYGSELPKWE